jgi:hypothetical protein
LDVEGILEGQQRMRIKNLLEGLNAQQRSVPQLPAQARAKHISVLGAKTDPKHPFAGYMVGADESAESGKKSIGPDRNDPYEKGWRAHSDAANPYASGTPEHAKWQDGRDEREAQPNHYDEGAAEKQLDEKCWDGYEKKGMKTMFGKRVPNCVKNEGEERNELDTPAVQAVLAKMAERHRGEKWSKEQLAALGKRIAARGQKPVKETNFAQAGEVIGGVLGGVGGMALTKGKKSGYVAGTAAGSAAGNAAGRWIDKKLEPKIGKDEVGATKAVARFQKPAVAEDDVAGFLARGGKITQVKPNRGPRNPGLSLGSRHIGGGGDGARASRTGRGSKPQGKPVVAVETDVDEGWKSKLAGAALAGAAAFGGGGAQAQTTAPTGVNATGTNAAVVQSLVNPVAQQRFAKMHADTTAKLTDPRYTHNPNALAQHQAAPQQQHAEMLQNIKNIEQWDNPYRIIQMAMNMAGVTPQEVLQNLPKGYKLPTTEPKGTFVPKDLSKLNVREDVTKEDIITKLKARLGDYLSDIGQEIRKDPDLINKLSAKAPGDQMGPPVKTITTDDGHQIQIHGNEDDGFRISIKNKQSASKFKNLDEAVMACEMYCARRRTQALNADYVEEA